MSAALDIGAPPAPAPAFLLEVIDGMTERLRLTTPGLAETIEDFSGGNQQKALIARWLMTEPRILLLDEPIAAAVIGATSLSGSIGRITGPVVLGVVISGFTCLDVIIIVAVMADRHRCQGRCGA